MEDLFYFLATYGGKIVSTGKLSLYEIEQAKAANRMHVDKNYLGYIWIPEFEKFPETPEEVEFFENWYPLEIEVPKNLNDRMMRVFKEIN